MFPLFLAQAAAAPAGPALWPTIEHAALVVALVGGIVGILIARRKRETRQIEPQPLAVEGDIRVTPKGRRWSAETCDERHSSIAKRLDGHDQQINEIWFTLREEDSKIRSALEAAIRDFDKTVNRLQGTLDAVEKTNDMILKKLLG